MCVVSVFIPDAVLKETKMTLNDTTEHVRQIVAMYYFTNHQISLGYCSEIAGMSKERFIRLLGENHISIFQFDEEQEFIEEVNNA